jgi:hypothetical protein
LGGFLGVHKTDVLCILKSGNLSQKTVEIGSETKKLKPVCCHYIFNPKNPFLSHLLKLDHSQKKGSLSKCDSCRSDMGVSGRPLHSRAVAGCSTPSSLRLLLNVCAFTDPHVPLTKTISLILHPPFSPSTSPATLSRLLTRTSCRARARDSPRSR